MVTEPEEADRRAQESLEEILLGCLERMEQEGEEALEDVCRHHPEQAEAIRRRVSALRNVGLLGQEQTFAGEASAAQFPERLGDFRLIRLLGGGGMGVVYLAEQEELGREVALKLVRPEQLYFPGARERFRREVETVAQLQHPGIVPIYTVGEEDGIPFFAMERVSGCTLDAALKELADEDPRQLQGRDLARAVARCTPEEVEPEPAPESVFDGDWEQTALRIIRQVADALEHVHRRGVVHRDIKPSNIMLTPGGRVMLCDFGLSSAQGTSRLTRTGSQLGSLFYMSPEQSRGEAAETGPVTDVYSLGVSLYELLALRPAYRGDSVQEVMVSIQLGERDTPRNLNPSISWEAETVCLTAMDPDPARRYRSAAEFSRDLTNVLERRPIAARRAGPWLRTRRWVQRHPVRSVTLLLGGLLVVGGPILFGLQESRGRMRVEVQRDAALAAKLRAERNFTKALAAVDQMLTRVADERLANVPQMEQVRRELLEDSLTFYRGFLEERGEDPGLRHETARVLRRVGTILVQLGKHDLATDRFDEAARVLKELISEQTESEPYRLELAGLLKELGGVHDIQGRRKEAEDAFGRAVETARELAGSSGASLEAQHLFATCEIQLGDHFWQLDPVRAEQHYLRARGRLIDLVEESPQSYESAYSLAHVDDLLGILLSQSNRSAQSVESYRSAVSILERLRRTRPDDSRVPMLLSSTLTNLAIELRFDQPVQSVQVFGQACDLRRELAENFPSTPRYRLDLAQTLGNLAGVTLNRKDFTGAEDALREGATLLRELIAADPTIPEYRDTLAFTLINLNFALRGQDRLEEAREAGEESVSLLERLVAESPANHNLVSRLADALARLSTVERRLDEFGLALELLDRAIDLQRAALAAAPQNQVFRRLLRVAYSARFDLRLRDREYEAAVDDAESIASLYPDSATEWHRAAGYLCECREKILTDDALSNKERTAAAERTGGRALELLDGAIERGFDDLEGLRKDPLFRTLSTSAEFQALVGP